MKNKAQFQLTYFITQNQSKLLSYHNIQSKQINIQIKYSDSIQLQQQILNSLIAESIDFILDISYLQQFTSTYLQQIYQFDRAMNEKFLKLFANIILEWGFTFISYLPLINEYYNTLSSLSSHEMIQLSRICQNLSYQYRNSFAPQELTDFILLTNKFYFVTSPQLQMVNNLAHLLLNQTLFQNSQIENLTQKILYLRTSKYINSIIMEIIDNQQFDENFLNELATKIQSQKFLKAVDYELLNQIILANNTIKIRKSIILKGIKSNNVERRINAVKLFINAIQLQNKIELLQTALESSLITYCQNQLENGDLYMQDILDLFRDYGLMSFE